VGVAATHRSCNSWARFLPLGRCSLRRIFYGNPSLIGVWKGTSSERTSANHQAKRDNCHTPDSKPQSGHRFARVTSLVACTGKLCIVGRLRLYSIAVNIESAIRQLLRFNRVVDKTPWPCVCRTASKPCRSGWLLPQLGVHIGSGIVSAIVSATIGAVLLVIILRIFRRGGRW
jgi:hypothetical protein